jgi:hypothetical protein
VTIFDSWQDDVARYTRRSFSKAVGR